jgi:hypothetical protein
MGAEQAQKPAGHEAPPLSVAPLQTAWLGSDAGKTDAVLPPWTPVVVNPSGDGFRIDVWGRSYLFDGAGAFPSQIVTKGENVLAQPIRLSGKMDGKVIEWKKAPIQLEQNKPAAAILTQNLVSSDEKVALSVRTQVEYDGMIRTDWKLEPRALARLEELTVEIPMKSECTKLMYCFPDYARRRFYGCGAVPEAGFKTAFTPFVWLGDNEKGLQWFCESDENWNIADPSQAIEIEQEGEKTVLRLRSNADVTGRSRGCGRTELYLRPHSLAREAGCEKHLGLSDHVLVGRPLPSSTRLFRRIGHEDDRRLQLD